MLAACNIQTKITTNIDKKAEQKNNAGANARRQGIIMPCVC